MVPRHGRLNPFPVGKPWERVSVDITGRQRRSSRQNQYILTCVDHFSKWAEAIPLRNHTASTVARALTTHVISRFGCPKQLLSDWGSEFESELFTELIKWLEIDKLRTTAYQPSTKGVVERFHRTLNSMLGKVVDESQRDWDDRLPAVLAAYRASPHESTGFSPNRLFWGREVRMPLDVMLDLPEGERDLYHPVDEFVCQTQEQMAKAYALAREHLRVAAERRKASYDVRVRDVEFSVGHWVWYWYPRSYPSKSPKWQRNYIGPYLVIRKIEPVNVVLQRSSKAKPFVVHVNKIKLCQTLGWFLHLTRLCRRPWTLFWSLGLDVRRDIWLIITVVDVFDDVCSFVKYVRVSSCSDVDDVDICSGTGRSGTLGTASPLPRRSAGGVLGEILS